MKKSIKIIFLLLPIIVCSFLLFSCRHKHEIVVIDGIAPTCTAEGITEGKFCSVCEETLVEQEKNPAKGHSEVVDEAIDATCVESGMTEGKHCSVCGEVIVAQEEIPAKGHKEVTDKGIEPTCLDVGMTEGKHCSVCGVVLVAQKEIAAKGHTEVKDNGTEATCTNSGISDGKHCSVCGVVLVEQNEIPANGHTEVTDKAIEPTCTEIGKTEGKHCSICGVVLVAQKEIAAKGHTEVKDNGTEATCTNSGISDGKHCSVCGEVLVKQTEIPAKGHAEVKDPLIKATCVESGMSAGSHCSVCGEVLVAQYVIPAKEHREKKLAAVEPTCEEVGKTEGVYCYICDEILVAQKDIPAKGHTEVKDSALTPTCTRPGATAGSHCSDCDKVLVAQNIIKAKGHQFGSNNSDGSKPCSVCNKDLWECLGGNRYGYSYLGTLSNGKNLQKLYEYIDEAVKTFHLDYNATVDESGTYDDSVRFVELEFAELGLNDTDVSYVWHAYFRDNSQYYWLSFRWYWYGTTSTVHRLQLHVESDYVSGSVRKKYNEMIMDYFNNFKMDKYDTYDIVLYLYDWIILNMDYEFAPDGSASNEFWAHNIIGFIEKGKGVCETYVRTLQVLLNYYGIDNIHVNGNPEAQHVWIMIDMDIGWFWFDPTWDDAGNRANHNYFCLGANDYVPGTKERFTNSHVAFTYQHSYEKQYALPKASAVSHPNVKK